MFTSLLRFVAVPPLTPTSPQTSEDNVLLSWPAFESSAERNLRILRSIHVPVSAFTIGPVGAIQGPPAEVIGEALNPMGTVGRLRNGSIGFLFLGPHGRQGDVDLTQFLRERVAGRLKDRGWPVVARSLEIAGAHGWTDGITGLGDLFRVAGALV